MDHKSPGARAQGLIAVSDKEYPVELLGIGDRAAEVVDACDPYMDQPASRSTATTADAMSSSPLSAATT